MNEAAPDVIKEHTRRLLSTMGFADVQIQSTPRSPAAAPGETPSIQVEIMAGSQGRLLIGAHGAHLSALQHIIRLIARRAVSAAVQLTVDVNGYQAGREETLRHMAEEAMRQAHRTGRAIVLPPMASPERRMIHAALSSRQNIKTESLGEEPNRRVVVRPTVI
jgi:spoIIIJ-associated protein